jgi:hypothetical protein
MGPAFVIFFWGIIALIFGIIWLALFSALIIGFRKGIWWLKWLAGVPLTLLSLAAFGFILVVGHSIYLSFQPEVAFQTAFGQLPPASVAELQSKNWAFADSGSIHLRFECPPETFTSLVSSNFTTASRATIVDKLQPDSFPHWWTLPAETNQVVFYLCENCKDQFSFENEFLIYDQSTQTALYYYLGID